MLVLPMPLDVPVPSDAVPVPALVAQAIAPANDGTNTLVIPNGNRLDITGGQLSRDGANLFHSFQKFGLNPQQIANFLSNPSIQNILGRVVGGSPSVIDGLIQVTGGTSNLYLMNPAGMIFGANASLNVPGSFTATTAAGIGLGCGVSGGGCGGWFSAVGANDYASLVGNANTFAFPLTQPGAIVNAGNLGVGAGQSLALIGGTVISTGTVSAPGGQITIAAVPGETLVRLSQAGSLLSLEFQPLSASNPLPYPYTPPSLPQLLTGGNLNNATGLTVDGNGQVRLTGSEVAIPNQAGTAIVAGTLDVSPAPFPTPQTGGTVHVLGQQIGLVGATVEATGNSGGGTVLIGGDYRGEGTLPTARRTYVDSHSSIYANAGQMDNGGNVVIWAEEVTGFYGNIQARGGSQSGNGGLVEVSGQQELIFRGDVDTRAPNGFAGTLLLDPRDLIIVSGNGSGLTDNNQLNAAVPAGDPQGQILAGHGLPGDFTISEFALEALPATTNVRLEATDNIIINPLSDGVLSFAAGPGQLITFTADSNSDGTGSFAMNPGDTIRTQGGAVAITGAGITTGHIDTSLVGNPTEVIGAVNLASTGTLTTGNITAENGSVTLSSVGDMRTGQLRIEQAFSLQERSVVLFSQAGNIEVATIRHRGRGNTTIQISAAGTFQATDSFLANFIGFDFVSGEESNLVPAVLNLPVSIGLDASDNLNPIRIFYGGATTSDPAFSVVSTHPILAGQTISIGGNGAPISVGPEVIGKIDPNAGDLVGITRNELYAPRPIPNGVSGTVGSISVGGGGNGNLFTSVQDIPFVNIGGGNSDPTGNGTSNPTGGGGSVGQVGGGNLQTGTIQTESNQTSGNQTSGSQTGSSQTGTLQTEGQTVQQQLNSQTNQPICDPSGVAAALDNGSVRSADPRSPEPGSNSPSQATPCGSTTESNILQILLQEPDPNGRK